MRKLTFGAWAAYSIFQLQDDFHSREGKNNGSNSSVEEMKEEIVKADYCKDNKEWKNFCEDGKDLVLKLLEINPEQRISAKEALLHKWLKDVNISK